MRKIAAVTQNEFKNTKQALSETDLERAERLIGYRLPSELRAEYVRHNGGQPIRRHFITSDGREYGVHEFRSIAHRASPKSRTLEETIVDLVNTRKLIPQHLTPFALNDGGDFFCIDRTTGGVVFYAMDDCLEPDIATVPLASSLRSFVDGMVAEIPDTFSEH